MTDAEKTAFIARLERAKEAAAARDLRITGYRVQGDRVTFDYAPLKTRRMRDDGREVVTTRGVEAVQRKVGRGVQGSLL